MKKAAKTQNRAKRLIPVLALLTAGVAYAGDTYVEPAPAPAPPSMWQWFAGTSVGYLDDMDDEFWGFHIGAEKFVDCYSHALFLEVGWTGDDDKGSIYAPPGTVFLYPRTYKVDVDIVPITLNYKFEAPLFGSERFHWYIGAGLGAMYGDIDLKVTDSMGYSSKSSNDDWIFYAQTAAGIVWNLSDRFEIFGGARYSWFDDINVGGETYNGSDQAMGEVGLRYNF